MSDSNNLLATGVSKYEHIAIFDAIAQLRFAALEVEKVLIYLVDTVDEDALLFLAEQFDLISFGGWDLADTVQKKRDLIKVAVELSRYKGTIYGIKEALRRVGFDNTEIQEHIGIIYDGSEIYDGSQTHGGGDWATFGVTFDLGNDLGISATQTAQLLAVVNEYKNARSVLVKYGWKASLTDTVTMTEDFQMTMIFAEDVEYVGGGRRYNGSFIHDGSEIYAGGGMEDTLDVTII